MNDGRSGVWLSALVAAALATLALLTVLHRAEAVADAYAVVERRAARQDLERRLATLQARVLSCFAELSPGASASEEGSR